MADQQPASDRIHREGRIKTAFSPHAPINSSEFFRGRIEQVRVVADAVTHPGLHVVLYGERGVGKTSLANILTDFLSEVLLSAAKVNCGQGDTFSDVIRRSVTALRFQATRALPGFGRDEEEVIIGLEQHLPPPGQDIAPDAAAELLSQLPPYVVVIVDEFDRLPLAATAAFADLVKALSDRGAASTILLVGVAEDVNDLIGMHASVERCLRQIRLQRMSDDEIREIIFKGLERADFAIEQTAQEYIVRVTQGFPQYAHLLAQNSARAALDVGSDVIGTQHVIAGMNVAVRYADQSHRDAYFKAVTGTKKQNLWSEVVAACALAESDERGYFSSRAVQDQLSEILGRPVIQQTVAFHLGKLTEVSRGPLLERIGPERRYRYRFISPLMRPFILMKATADNLVRNGGVIGPTSGSH